MPADAGPVRDFLAGLGEEARWFRFFSAGVNLDRAAHDFVMPLRGARALTAAFSRAARAAAPANVNDWH